MPNPFFWGLWVLLSLLVAASQIALAPPAPSPLAALTALSAVYCIGNIILGCCMAGYWFQKER